MKTAHHLSKTHPLREASIYLKKVGKPSRQERLKETGGHLINAYRKGRIKRRRQAEGTLSGTGLGKLC